MSSGPLNAVRDAVRSQLWPLPVLSVGLALVAGVVLPMVDRATDRSLPGWLDHLLFSGDPGAARTVLDAVSSSLITVTSLTFSLTVVTLQLASSQFSPRLLRTFTSDVFVQATLGLFLATFTFALTVLRGVRSDGMSQSAFVPRIAVTLSFVLAVVSVGGLIVFLAHLARQIRVETMLAEVHDDASTTIDAVLAPRGDADDSAEGRDEPVEPPRLTPPADAVLLRAPDSGFLVSLDERELLEAAVEAHVSAVVDAGPGAFVVAGSPIGAFWSEAGRLDATEAGRVDDALSAAFRIGHERTAAQDVGFGLRQLTDVTNKALSPGINDPTTAVHALGHISAVLCELAGRRLGPVALRDDDDRVRVVLARPGLAELVDAAITQPRRYGASDPQVVGRLLTLLAELAWHCAPVDRGVVVTELERLRATIADADFDDVERERFDRGADDVVAALDGVRREVGARSTSDQTGTSSTAPTA